MADFARLRSCFVNVVHEALAIDEGGEEVFGVEYALFQGLTSSADDEVVCDAESLFVSES